MRQTEAAVKNATYVAASLVGGLNPEMDRTMKSLNRQLGPDWIEQIIDGVDERTLRSGTTFVKSGGMVLSCESVATFSLWMSFVAACILFDNMFTPTLCPRKTVIGRWFNGQESMYCSYVNTFVEFLQKWSTDIKFAALRLDWSGVWQQIRNINSRIGATGVIGYETISVVFRSIARKVICPLVGKLGALAVFSRRTNVTRELKKSLEEHAPEITAGLEELAAENTNTQSARRSTQARPMVISARKRTSTPPNSPPSRQTQQTRRSLRPRRGEPFIPRA